ncbi:MAG: hypothetical protein JWP75_1195 [Frondihabitans sp.]|nr:hypothetical protein [Frondihabitans sp.]
MLDTIVAERRWSELAKIIDAKFFALLLSEPRSLRAALDALPEEWLHAHPRYLMSREIISVMGPRFRMMDDSVATEFAGWVEASATPASRDVLGVLQARLRFLLAVGRFSDANDVADSTLAIIHESDDTAGFADVVPVVLIRVGLTKLLFGDVTSAIATFADSVRWSSAAGNHPAGPHARNYLALCLALAGDVHGAARELRYDESETRSEPGTLAHSYEHAGILANGLIALARFDQATTTRVVESLDDDITNSELWWIVAHLRARHTLYWGDRPSSISALEGHLVTRRALSGPRSLAGTTIRSDLADLYQAVGNYPAAAHVLTGPGTDSSDAIMLPARVRLDLLLGHHDAALRRLTSHGLVTSGRDYTPPGLLTLKAAAETTVGSTAQMMQTLKQAAVSVSQTGAIHAIAEAPPEIRVDLAALAGIDASTLPTIFARSRSVHLTERERDVLRALKQNSTMKDLATALHVSPNTAKTHLSAVYRKLSVHTREQALRAGADFD